MDTPTFMNYFITFSQITVPMGDRNRMESKCVSVSSLGVFFGVDFR